MASYTQEGRLISVTTPLGKDVLLLAGFKGREAISGLFSFELDLLSSNYAIAFEEIIGKRATVKVELAGKGARYFNGVVSRFSQAAGQEADGGMRLFQYRATLVPWTWLLTRTSDARIFQNLSVPDILDRIFKEKGFSDVSVELQGTYSPREYCVQYRETDFNFISRLMEEEGIYYYFTHTEKTHTMVIADSPGMHKKLSRPVRHYRVAGAFVEEDTITVMEKYQEIQAGKYTLNDFNFEIPNTTLKASMDSGRKVGPGERERYDYPGGYEKKADGDRIARLRMEEEEARITTIDGSGNCREFCGGFRFTLKNALRPDMNDKEYVLTSVSHEASQPLEQGGVPNYRNSFTCIPFEVPFRPPLVTIKPTIQGSQTAIVVGKSGEEIYTDKYGRVKVQFHWDREGKKDENASCWIRVGQIWAGQGWGAVWIPRIGHEVIVSFLEGDPDRPLITGSVYDGTNMPPYSLPGEMTKSTIKSNSSKSGGGFNEIRFEDKKGGEQIFIHAQKNMDLTVQNDRFETVKHDQHLTVAHDLIEEVKNEHHDTVESHRYTSIGKDRHLDVKGKEAKQVAESLSLTVKGDVIEAFKAAHSEETAKDYYLKAQNVVIEGMKNITLSVGGSYIAIEAGSIEIKTSGQLTVEATQVSVSGSATTKVDGAQVSISGSAMTEIKGGLVKIN